MKAPIVLLVALAFVGGCSWAPPPAPVQRSGPALDVIYVPTDLVVVRAMLEAAKVGPGDVVYDLGCGDGRIVVTAASDYGARGVGVDLDPKRIREAEENAARAGVSDRVTFIQEDFFKTDVTAATVVALYLSPDLNLKLRPKLLDQLQPGARVVSHQFDMGDWRPAQSMAVQVSGVPHRVYLWRILDFVRP